MDFSNEESETPYRPDDVQLDLDPQEESTDQPLDETVIIIKL